jgi:hypothetical protein
MALAANTVELARRLKAGAAAPAIKPRLMSSRRENEVFILSHPVSVIGP